MSAVTGRLRIALQKSGRLADRSLDLVRDAGLRVMKGHNDLLYRVENYPIDLLRVRDDDIPTLVRDGIADLGVRRRPAVPLQLFDGQGRGIVRRFGERPKAADEQTAHPHRAADGGSIIDPR